MARLRRIYKRNSAVSEVLGTILILVISVSSFSAVYAVLFSIQVEPSSPFVNIVGTIEDNTLILEHRGGDSLQLNTNILLNLPDGSRYQYKVDDLDYLNSSYKNDGRWDIGERFVLPLNSVVNYSRFEPIDVTTVDVASNSVIMMGTVKETEFTDINISYPISELKTKLNEIIQIEVIAKNEGLVPAEDIVIKDLVKDGLKYLDHSATHGDYHPETGLWKNFSLDVTESAVLTISARVIPLPSETFTQVAIILDGSNSSAYKWGYMKLGLSNAIRCGYIPHNGLVELTVIQYGTKTIESAASIYDNIAQVEIGPVVLTDSNYIDIADDIFDISHLGGLSPLSAGFNLARMTLKNSPNFNPSNIHILNLVIASIPDCQLLNINDVKSYYTSYQLAKADATSIRNLLINDLGMTQDQDQINAEIARLQYSDYITDKMWSENRSWLSQDIVWPNSNYIDTDDTWPPQAPGWVRQIDNADDLFECLSVPFLFHPNSVSERYNTAKLISTTIVDNNPENNEATLKIKVGG